MPSKYFKSESYDSQGDPSQDFSKFQVHFAKRCSEIASSQLGVSCWHVNQYEPESFWRNYSKEGVAIKTTFGKLKNCLQTYNKRDVYIGKVKYVDEQWGDVDLGNLFNHILWKRKNFEYESEVRAVIWAPSGGDNPIPLVSERGEKVEVNLECLIEEVVTTPFVLGDWFNETVSATMSMMGLSKTSRKSSLFNKPFN